MVTSSVQNGIFSKRVKLTEFVKEGAERWNERASPVTQYPKGAAHLKRAQRPKDKEADRDPA